MTNNLGFKFVSLLGFVEVETINIKDKMGNDFIVSLFSDGKTGEILIKTANMRSHVSITEYLTILSNDIGSLTSTVKSLTEAVNNINTNGVTNGIDVVNNSVASSGINFLDPATTEISNSIAGIVANHDAELTTRAVEHALSLFS
jgi:hypothetical protein